jgi:type I restriction enzyme, S subunit
MSLRKHAEYKESGLPLTPIAPSHWSRTALKYLGNYQNGYPFKPEDRGEEGLPIIRISQLTSDDEPAYFKGELDQRVKVATGDLLFSWSATIDAYIWSRGDAWLNQHIFKVTESQEASKDFLYYVIKHIAPKLADFDAHGSTMRHIKKESLGEKLYIPPQQEQLAIANFLDRETTKIDALIAEQQRLIELLQEKRQSVISHAVTKGLNPNAPLKDSGVEWLGEVPEHWEVCGLSHTLKAIGDVDHYMPSTVAEGVPYLMTGDLQELTSQIDFNDCKQVSHEEYEKLSRKIKTANGDLIMARYATIGTVAYVDVERDLLVSYSCVTMKPNIDRTCGMFLFYCLKSDSFSQGIKHKINANTQENVGIGDLKKVKVAIPPLNEQQQISEYLQAAISEMTKVIQASKDTVRLLQERRSALISAAVTGQIDVRGLTEEIAA